MKVENRFLKYVSFNTQSDPYATSSPSTANQKELAEFLVEEMRILGLVNVQMSEYGVVYGTIPSNNNHQGDVIGFIAHMDTSPDASGDHIQPQIIRNYDGHRIILNENMILDPQEFPDLKKVVGHDIIATDGTTLLGADDKAGIAIIMSMAEYMFKHPEFKHNDIQIAFTPDEEVGRGSQHFDLNIFQADYAYTIDGGDINEFYFENFNAYQVLVEVTGKSIHPGAAKNKMVNSLEVAIEFDQLLPQNCRPEYTEGYEGFHHLNHMQGSCEKTRLEYIVRDHHFLKLKEQLNDFHRIQAYLNSCYGYELIDITMNEQYLNMKDILVDHPQIVEQVELAMRDIGLNPTIVPIRGGTDGARLSYLGLPCPNIGTGGFYCHGPYEFVSISMMKKGIELLLRLLRNNVYSKEDMPF
ncbi:peptidase T [Candidatus Stoquefichus massiliensis]|uniref:peptidase T n=1 Tax=Candidatus Stoquefichus massiliensis TaxID=1470350 RepID=UPI0004829651|nr:peptidase T [Candidatus Stoquefichus massiliensis]